MPTVDNQTDTGYYYSHGPKKSRAKAFLARHGQARIAGMKSQHATPNSKIFIPNIFL